MKPTSATIGAMALVALLTLTEPSRADLIHWSYNWSRFPGDILPDNPASGGKISLTDESLKNAVGDSDIVATNIRTFSTAPADNPDQYTNKPYTLSLFLRDQTSSLGGTVNFKGVLNGLVSANSSVMTNTFTGDTTHTLILGAHRFTASIGSFTPPGPPNATNSGSISAHVTVTVELIRQLPEPSTFVLTALGVVLLVLARYRNHHRFPLLPA